MLTCEVIKDPQVGNERPMPLPAAERIRVLVSDSSTMACELLADRLRRAHFEVANCCSNSTDLLRSAVETSHDVILVSADLEDGHLSGFYVLRELHEQRLPSRVIVLLRQRDRDQIISSFRGGARGVFYRAEPFSQLLKCIRAVNLGQFWASSTDLEHVLGALTETAPLRNVRSPMRPLTKREEEIASLVAQGLSNREIANRLFLSEHTIKNYVFRIFEKLSISSRVELALHCSQPNRLL